jgi:hypothetical protein
MKKAVILLLLCFALASVATTSKANSALMATLRQNARQLTTFTSAPAFPFIAISWSYNSSSFTVKATYFTSWTVYTLDPVSYTIIGGIELNVDQYGNPGNTTYSIGGAGSDESGYISSSTGIYTWTVPYSSVDILNFRVNDVTPRELGSVPVWITEGDPTSSSYYY